MHYEGLRCISLQMIHCLLYRFITSNDNWKKYLFTQAYVNLLIGLSQLHPCSMFSFLWHFQIWWTDLLMSHPWPLCFLFFDIYLTLQLKIPIGWSFIHHFQYWVSLFHPPQHPRRTYYCNVKKTFCVYFSSKYKVRRATCAHPQKTGGVTGGSAGRNQQRWWISPLLWADWPMLWPRNSSLKVFFHI